MKRKLLWNCSLALALASIANPALAQNPSAAAQPIRPYAINAGDEIEVYVWGEERLQRVIRVLPDGTFSFPLVGSVNALGKLPAQIEGLISNGLKAQYRGEVPQITVSVKNPSGLQFSVAGRVKSPGIFTPGRYVNLLEALSFAGGPDEFASLDRISIVRKEGGGLVTIPARMGGVFKGGAAGRDIPQIESGDTVIVP